MCRSARASFDVVVETERRILDDGLVSERILVTAALPYANGSIHIGHLVEYIMTDVYVRALKMAGHDALFVCADDTHGTPIEINARKAGVTPEDFVARFAEEHYEDLSAFGVRFDSFYTTNSEENRKWVHYIYERLKEGGHLERRKMDQLYDEQAQRFLPDRFVKGTCPKCGTPDQYGDVCENCKSTYEPTDLKDPYSTLTGTRPVVKSSEHVFVRLRDFADFLQTWAAEAGRLQPEIGRFVQAWLDGGLQDWCISRDAPYFGFEIPDAPGKYFYVWLDAPIGYIASTDHWGQKNGEPDAADRIWKDKQAKVVHVIGKDIIYFHCLFWPAMLHAAGLATPSHVRVHGFLTVNGVKMSKSRGTFIMARTFREHLDPTYLRYYFGAKTGQTPEDIDLSFEEFVNRVNAELVNTLANLVSRSASFLKTKLGGEYGTLPADAKVHTEATRHLIDDAVTAYQAFDHAAAVRCAVQIADLGNKLFQDGAPWNLIKSDRAATLQLVTLCLNLARAATVIVAPVVPEYAAKVYTVLGLDGEPRAFEEAGAFDLIERPMGTPARLVDRLSLKQVEPIVEASKTPEAPAPETSKSSDSASPSEPIAEQIDIDRFLTVDLRVGLIVNAQKVKKAKKLLQLTVDLGEGKPRNIFAGIAQAYEPETLVGKKVAVVANLAPRKMSFGVSEGMVLAAGPGGQDIQVVQVPDDAAPGSRIR